MSILSETIFITEEYTNSLINFGVSKALERLWYYLPESVNTPQWSIFFVRLVKMLDTENLPGYTLILMAFDDDIPFDLTHDDKGVEFHFMKLKIAVDALFNRINYYHITPQIVESEIVTRQKNIQELILQLEELGASVKLKARPHCRQSGYRIGSDYDDDMNLISTDNAVYLDIIQDGSENEHKLIGVKAIPPKGVTIRHLLSCISIYIEMYSEDATSAKAEMIDVINNPDL